MAFNLDFLDEEEEEPVLTFNPMNFDVGMFAAYNTGDHSYANLNFDPSPETFNQAGSSNLFPDYDNIAEPGQETFSQEDSINLIPGNDNIAEPSVSVTQTGGKRRAPDEELDGISSRKRARIDPAAGNDDGAGFQPNSGSEQRAPGPNPPLALPNVLPINQPQEGVSPSDYHDDNGGENQIGNDQRINIPPAHPRAATPSSGRTETENEKRKRIRREKDRVRREEHWRKEEEGMRPDNVCEFCKTDPIGILAHTRQRCNFIWNDDMTVECQNCADHRSKNPGLGMKCRVQKQEMELVRYGVNDPVTPSVSACDRCTRLGIENTCDVDAFVGMSCRNCKTMCLVGGTAQKGRLDEKIAGRPWYRHACERCTVGPNRVQDSLKCSWLSDRSTWDRGCNRCLDDGTGCLKSGHLIYEPDETQFVAPNAWAVPSMREMEAETTELKLNSTPWRRMCTACQEFRSQNTCRVPFNQLWTACIRCTQLGIDCVNVARDGGIDMDFSDQDEEAEDRVPQPKKRGRPRKKRPKRRGPVERVFPIANLSRVGFGKPLPFEICKRCLQKNRACDRQRPCDSCVNNDEQDKCDKFERSKSKARKLHNCMVRSKNPQGPLYYLALGYGPGGVNTVKEGSRPLDWIGPVVPKYGAEDVKGGGTIVKPFAEAVATEAGRLRPEGAPPHGGPGGSLRDVRPSQLTEEMLDIMLVACGINGGPNTAWRYRQVVQLMTSPHWPKGWRGVQLPPPGPAAKLGAKPAELVTQETQKLGPDTDSASASSHAPQVSWTHVPGHHQLQAPESHFDNMVRAAAVAHQLGHSGQGAPSNAFSDYLNQRAVERGMIQSSPSQATSRDANTQGAHPTLPTSQFVNTSKPQDDSSLQKLARADRSKPESPISPDLQPSRSTQRGIDNAVPSQAQSPVQPRHPAQPQAQTQEEQAQVQPPVQPQTSASVHQAGDQALERYNDQGRPEPGSSFLDHLNADGMGFDAGNTWLFDRLQAESQQNPPGAPIADDGMPRHAPDDLLGPEQAAGVTFNPFLGTNTALLPTERRARQPTSQRWEPYNYLEGIAMEHWQEQQQHGPQDLTHPGIYRLFGLSGNKFIADNPARDVLAETELQPSSANGPHGTCMEPVQAGGLGICGRPVADLTGCRSLTHRDNNPQHFLVCEECQEESARVLVDREGSAISRCEIFAMRAYTCDECAEIIISNNNAAATLPNDGTRRIWGLLGSHAIPPGVIYGQASDITQRSIKYEARTMPATGCSCAAKLLELPLCRYHRLFYAELAMRQVALVKEFRLLRFHKHACPRCLNFKGTRNANLSADAEEFRHTARRPTAWVCLACNDWVVNQRNDASNKPQLVPGRLGSLDVNEWFPGTDAS